MQSTNTFSVETSRGVRCFHLHEGDICDSNDDLVVASSHANSNAPPSGQVIRALATRHGYDFSALEPLLAPRANFGTFFTEGPKGRPPVLVLRVPGASSIEKDGGVPLDVFEDALWTLFGSLAALEFKGRFFSSISIPLLAGSRDYPINLILTQVLQSAVKWLRISQATQSVTLYVFRDHDFSQWFSEMDSLLGRKYFDAAKDSILEGLRQELLGLLNRAKTRCHQEPRIKCWLDDLQSGLTEERLRFQSFAVAGRKLAEFVVAYLSDQLLVKTKGELYDDIKKLRETKHVAPWAIDYLLSLKDFGNVDAHIPDDKPFKPKTVNRDDLLALLCGVQRLIQIWLDWESEAKTL